MINRKNIAQIMFYPVNPVKKVNFKLRLKGRKGI